jgi:hypothetical protein
MKLKNMQLVLALSDADVKAAVVYMVSMSQ